MSKATILIADNDEDCLDMIEESLTGEGYDVIRTMTPAETRTALQDSKRHLDLAVLDMRLRDDHDDKDITGQTLAKTLGPLIPKIILTKFPTYEAVREALQPAIDGLPAALDFVDKAEGIDALLASIRHALGTGRTETGAAEGRAPSSSRARRGRQMSAVVLLLLALTCGIIAVITGQPGWLLGTILAAIFAVLVVGISF